MQCWGTLKEGAGNMGPLLQLEGYEEHDPGWGQLCGTRGMRYPLFDTTIVRLCPGTHLDESPPQGPGVQPAEFLLGIPKSHDRGLYSC